MNQVHIEQKKLHPHIDPSSLAPQGMTEVPRVTSRLLIYPVSDGIAFYARLASACSPPHYVRLRARSCQLQHLTKFDPQPDKRLDTLAGSPSRGRRVLPPAWWRTHNVVRYSERTGPADRSGPFAVAGAVGRGGRVVVDLFRDKLEELTVGDVVVSAGVLSDCRQGKAQGIDE